MYMIYDYVFGVDLLEYSKKHMKEAEDWGDIPGIESAYNGGGEYPLYIGKIYGTVEPGTTRMPKYGKRPDMLKEYTKRKNAALAGIDEWIEWGKQQQDWSGEERSRYQTELENLRDYIKAAKPKQFIAESSS